MERLVVRVGLLLFGILLDVDRFWLLDYDTLLPFADKMAIP